MNINMDVSEKERDAIVAMRRVESLREGNSIVGDIIHEDGSLTVTRYIGGHHPQYAVYDGSQMICLCVYKKGAMALVEYINKTKGAVKGTGSAMKMKLYPARVGDLDSGAIYMTIATQSSLGDRRSTPPIYPKFDWDNALKVKLDFTDLAKVLQVLRGETESIDEGKGLFHHYSDKYQAIRFRHMIEPICGYSLEVCETPTDANAQTSERNARIFLSSAEALGLSLVIEHSFAAIAFGVPVI